MCIYIYIHIFMCVCIYIYIYIYVYIYIYIEREREREREIYSASEHSRRPPWPSTGILSYVRVSYSRFRSLDFEQSIIEHRF